MSTETVQMEKKDTAVQSADNKLSLSMEKPSAGSTPAETKKNINLPPIVDPWSRPEYKHHREQQINLSKRANFWGSIPSYITWAAIGLFGSAAGAIWALAIPTGIGLLIAGLAVSAIGVYCSHKANSIRTESHFDHGEKHGRLMVQHSLEMMERSSELVSSKTAEKVGEILTQKLGPAEEQTNEWREKLSQKKDQPEKWAERTVQAAGLQLGESQGRS